MQRLIVQCQCGGYASIHALFVNDANCLVFDGQCLDCMNRVVSSIPLADVYKISLEQRKGRPLIPPVGSQVEMVEEKPEHTDHEWYKIFGIKEE